MDYNQGPTPEYQVGTMHNLETGKWHVIILASCDVHKTVHPYVSKDDYATEAEAATAADKQANQLEQEMLAETGELPLRIENPSGVEKFRTDYTPPPSKFNPLNN
jgi:hypothetical protein